ncbi:MAG: type II secretion system protein [Dehalococcoidales bacterium]|nr:type II secretion system protein [Dehalococcoidales bacterium]
MFKMIKRENGFTLVEVLVALSIMVIVALIFLLALIMAGKAVLLAQEKTIAESIARSQMEYVKQQGYNYDGATYSGYYVYLTNTEVLTEHPGFTVWSVSAWAEENTLVEEVRGVNWDGVDNIPDASDSGIQKIGLVIKHGENVVFYLEGYVVDK